MVCTMLRDHASTPQHTRLGALAPLRSATFRMLWLAWLAANITVVDERRRGRLADDLADPDPVLVALVQTASTLPVFLLGLPSGALADILDRRRYFAGTQLWVAVNALLLAALSLADTLTAPLLLALTFVNGIGAGDALAGVRGHRAAASFRATQLPAALALNGIAMNLSRVVGPVLAGALLAPGSAAVFVAQRRAVGGGLRADPALAPSARTARCPASASSARCASACSTCASRRA